ncbi:hypothetical protein LY474_02365 [Myxococcus stipitatus]|uniref:hypothetical protein n=1 Tax=Myxococcus stipitatus TaxID=83455 RepID=UPI001F3EA958|nr:hypothetical protein [Myxococcus stipitatus]MCE9666645.1 hypothetical protein [Myxococcus stipitatus]
MSTQNSKKAMLPLPPEPPALAEKREKLLVELEAQTKTAQGSYLQVVRTMKMLIASTNPTAPLDERLYGDVTGALNRFTKDPVLPIPPLLGELVSYLQERLSTYGTAIQNELKEINPELHAKMAVTLPGAPAAAPAAPAAPPARTTGAGAKDGFESSSKRSLSLDPEANPPPPAPGQGQKDAQLESFKAWMKNPSLGKLKG